MAGKMNAGQTNLTLEDVMKLHEVISDKKDKLIEADKKVISANNDVIEKNNRVIDALEAVNENREKLIAYYKSAIDYVCSSYLELAETFIAVADVIKGEDEEMPEPLQEHIKLINKRRESVGKILDTMK